MPTRNADRRRRAAWGLALLLTLSLAQARAEELRPFEVAYTWTYKGLSVAYTTLELVRRDSETWVYRSHSEPRGIGRLLNMSPAMESVMRVTDANGVQPLTYNAVAGTSPSKRDVHVSFDWEHGKVTGVYEDTPMDLPLPAGTQDDLSVQVALMNELLHGRTPQKFLLLDKHGPREYIYTREKEETLDTPIGKVPTVVYKSTKEGSSRANHYWCAPGRGFLPLRVQQTTGVDNVEWTMEIQKARRD